MKKPNTAMFASAVTALALALTGCSEGGQSGESGASGDALDVYLNMTTGSAQYAAIQDLAQAFEDQTGTPVNITIDSSNFENNMKVRMAAGNLPDVWTTHGWSVLRYGPFLEPLTDRPWAQYVNKGLDESMRDDSGTLYALPIDYTVTGVLTNFDVLDEAGVDPGSIATWDDFDTALAKIKAIGKTPLVSSGKDSGPAGDLANVIAANAFTDDQLEEFTNGTFDTDAYQKGVLDRIGGWAQQGYFSADYVSASIDDMSKQLATGEAAFAGGQPSLLATSLTYNPDANVGFIPFPSNGSSGQYLVGGEGMAAFGVWKDSPRKDDALAFLDFLAEPDNASVLLKAYGSYSGLTNVSIDLGTLQPSYDQWVAPAELPTKPFFDRVYLPNGMWSTMVSSTDAVISQQASPAEGTKQMADQYATLFGQQD
ncbi:MAG: ABC transporter substrate-binding protein [Actinomyces sp.]|jgi:raffinose/stachyose/melibiose transport system substrate-binding protein|nr:ABC transporter substrate-binding protein [Actinomyces sp.]MCI1787620.1 ABC transporter substrate-binding protein [Actinomyces sp.]MCI1830172.1 ABC transporter substrate-binding protein [Actinomyces sp.]MCI1866740.1 ABC transporter substrate-binding protein [Actinomyces sp.]